VSYVMGIDGGGSRVRAVVVTPDLVVIGSAEGGSANPMSAGRDAAARNVQSAIRAALADAHLSPDEIAAAGVGIAGTVTARAWARAMVAAALPNAAIRIASDSEIALVGARGERRGVLILAGTGSVAYGVNAAGEAAQVGGWGYLLGDEGSGYWIGLKALQAVARAADGREPPTRLSEPLLSALGLGSAQDLIQWIYTSARTQVIAALAPRVLAEASDPAAQQIIAKSVAHLAALGRTVALRLKIESAGYAFAGGLLGEPNPVSEGLCAALGLPSIPVPKYPPVIGAALLALAP